MECPECGNKMLKNNDIWECSKCDCTYVINNDNNIFTKINADDISNKINDFRESDNVGKIIKGIGTVAEQVSIQAKKEQAYIKTRTNEESTALVDDNEFFISKHVFDGVDFINNKKQEFKKENASKNQNKTSSSLNVTNDKKQDNSSNSESSKINKNNKKNNGGSFFNKKSPEQKEFDEKFKYYLGGFLPSDYYMAKKREHGKSAFNNEDTYVEDIIKTEFKNGKLSVEDMESRLDELLDLDTRLIKRYMLDEKYDTSIIKTEEDFHKFLDEEYDEETAEKVKMKNKEYRKGALFKKYGIDTEEAYCFECVIEERRASTFSNDSRRNVDDAYVALYDEYVTIIKESYWLKSDMGMRRVYFNNVASIDYDTSGKIGMSSSLFIHMNSGEYVHLKFISKENVDEIHKRYENFINKKDIPNTVQINQETSNADELLKYAELYKQGLLTEEEFEAKKKELL